MSTRHKSRMVYPPWQASIDDNLSNFDKLMASFCEAASRGDFGLVVYMMVRVGLSPMRSSSKRGWSGRSPLMVACIGGHSDCVAAMLTLSLDANTLGSILNSRCDYGCTAFDYACQYRSEKCMCILLHTGVPVDSAMTPTYRAIALAILDKMDVAFTYDDEPQLVKDGSGKRWKGRLMELTYKLTPWSMGLSFICTFMYLLLRLSPWVSTDASEGFSSKALVAILLMESMVCALVVMTVRRDAGVYSASAVESGIEYGDWIKRECLEGDAEASPRSQGIKVPDTAAYRARMELTRAAINVHCCHICRCWRPAGTKHSSRTGRCVKGFDHYCLFFATDVGLNNQTYFICAVLGFNATLPLLLMDMSILLTGRQQLLWLPVAALTKIWYTLASSSSSSREVALLASMGIWLYLIWIFVLLLLIQLLYRRFIGGGRLSAAAVSDSKKQQ